ncbi:MAG TPA: ATP-dependent DNA helicase, partial [Pyrinomonadaceae bacterium]|nr:ATP-dependent DNA helicase [Pyrinomonadaceae bacterium]
MQENLIQTVFGPGGLIAKSHENYEYREGQIKMSDAIAEAFEKKRHLIVEAGTGTGKTLAYLIPAIAQARKTGKRIVISTGTKNLQEQLMEKDIPFLQKTLPKNFSAAYMKGRANYACLYRVHKAENQPILDGLDEMSHFDEVRRWITETTVGDRAELTGLPENLSFWNRINAKGETCIGQKCPDFEPCFITRMRVRAEDADIVIVNHHLFFADLNVRGNQFGKVIPDYAAVIFDEAHLIEDIASDYFGFQVSSFQIDELVRDSDSLPITDALITRDMTKVAAKIASLADQFWIRFSQAKNDGRYPLMREAFSYRTTEGDEQPTPLMETYEALDASLKTLETLVDAHGDGVPEAESLVRRIRQTRFDLDFIVTQAERNYVYWLEKRGRGMFLRASPVDVSELLREKLFDKVETCILTSATLSSNSSFNFVRERLGLDTAKTSGMIAPSAFDYESQAILYLPKAMPDPRSPEFTQIAAGEIVKIL